MRDKIIKFMQGRYGVYVPGWDTLMKWTLPVSFILLFIGTVLPIPLVSAVMSAVAALILGWQIFRFLSKNIAARQRENSKFIQFLDDVSITFGGKTEGDKKIYRCPKCRTKVRVPKGRGKIRITCPKCGAQFIKKS